MNSITATEKFLNSFMFWIKIFNSKKHASLLEASLYVDVSASFHLNIIIIYREVYEAVYPSNTSGDNIPNRSRNSSNDRFVGYPAQLILIASKTPCHQQQLFSKARWTLNLINSINEHRNIYLPRILIGLWHWSSQRFLASKLN